jgi:hypothetical protein
MKRDKRELKLKPTYDMRNQNKVKRRGALDTCQFHGLVLSALFLELALVSIEIIEWYFNL